MGFFKKLLRRQFLLCRFVAREEVIWQVGLWLLFFVSLQIAESRADHGGVVGGTALLGPPFIHRLHKDSLNLGGSEIPKLAFREGSNPLGTGHTTRPEGG